MQSNSFAAFGTRDRYHLPSAIPQQPEQQASSPAVDLHRATSRTHKKPTPMPAGG